LLLLFTTVLPYSISYAALHRAIPSAPSPAQVDQNLLIVNAYVYLSPEYRLISLADLPCPVRLNIKLQVTQVLNVSSIELHLPVQPSIVPPGSEHYLSMEGYWVLRLPATNETMLVTCEGIIRATSFLFRNVVSLRSFPVSTNINCTTAWTTLVILPDDAKLFGVDYPVVDFEGRKAIPLPAVHGYPYAQSVLYEPINWEFGALVASTICIALLALFPYIADQANRIKVKIRIHRVFAYLRDYIDSLIQKTTPNKLIVLLLLCGVLMVSLSATAGPDPRLKIYVLASRPTTLELKTFIQEEVSKDILVYTLEDEVSDFDLLCRLNVVSAVIIADHPHIPEEWSDDVFGGLRTSRIFILEEYAHSDLASDVKNNGIPFRLGDRAELRSFLMNRLQGLQESALLAGFGLSISYSEFIQVASVVAILSFVIVIIGCALLVTYSVNAGSKRGVLGIPETIFVSIFIFFFIQGIYSTCTSLLATPLGLHAGKPGMTILYYIGPFGGGSTPRALFGFIGYWIGALIQYRNKKLPLSRVGILAFIFIMFILFLNPLTSGVFMHEIVYGYLLPFQMQLKAEMVPIVRSIISIFAQMLRTRFYSHGIVLYFALSVPLCALSKVNKTTATFLALLISLPLTHNGFMRVGEIDPIHALNSMMPGILLGFFVFVVFLLISYLETLIVRRLRR